MRYFTRSLWLIIILAKLHARSVAKHLGVKQGLIYLPGQPTADIPDSDQPVPFRQRRYFYYLSGADFEDCSLLYDVGTDYLTLFIPSADPRDVVWLGPVPSIEECESKYDVDHVCHLQYLKGCILDWIIEYRKADAKIYVLHEDQTPKVSDSLSVLDHKSGTSFTIETPPLFNSTLLKPAMDAARVIKSPYEISMIRKANKITAAAHRAVLTRVSKLTNEIQIEAIFQAACVFKGAKKQAYGVIAGSGANASTLHYVANNEPLKNRELVVLDAGCEWDCYASDVTRSFPISGTWSEPAKEIYDLVASMQDTVLAHMKPGVVFRDLHIMSMCIAVRGLMKLGILHNGTFEQVLGTGVAFYPHGLGHHLGLECHDVNDTQSLLANIATHHDLRHPTPHLFQQQKALAPPCDTSTAPPPYTKRQKLEPGMVITVEPGIYFSRFALENYWLKNPIHRKYVNVELLERYYPVGGVRIEDDFLITEDGWENLTTAPKGEEALKIIRGEGDKKGEEEDWFM